MADKTRTYRIASLGFERRPRLTRSTRRSPWATMMIFPGSGQSLRDFSAQFSAAAWAERGVHVIELAPRYATGRTWRPGPKYPRTKTALIDLVAVRHAWETIVDPDRSLNRLPLWFAGHSGGACFAHVAAWALAIETRVEGVVSNAGWLWPWLAERHAAQVPARVFAGLGRTPKRVAFRVGDKDRLFNASRRRTAFDGADVYEQLGCEVARWTVPGRHEWLAQHDDDLAAWMRGG